MHIVPVASERGELRQGALPRVEAVEQWKTVLRGRADGRSGGWVGRAGHNHTEWAFSCPEPARVSPERSRRPDQRGVARRSTEVVVVRQLSIRLEAEVRQVWVPSSPSCYALTLLVDLRLGKPIVGVILCSWGVGIADGGAYLRDVVAVTWAEKLGVRTGCVCQ